LLLGQRGEGEAKTLYRDILDKAIRCQDPFFAVKRRWLVRRLAPDCSKVELADLQKEQEVDRLLHAMGWETANVHLGSATATALLVDLASRPDGWLHEAAKEMVVAVQEDWRSWKKPAAVKNRKAPAASP